MSNVSKNIGDFTPVEYVNPALRCSNFACGKRCEKDFKYCMECGAPNRNYNRAKVVAEIGKKGISEAERDCKNRHSQLKRNFPPQEIEGRFCPCCGQPLS